MHNFLQLMYVYMYVSQIPGPGNVPLK